MKKPHVFNALRALFTKKVNPCHLVADKRPRR